MNILQMIIGLLLPMVLAAQRPLPLGAESPFGMDMNQGSTTLSGYKSIVNKTFGETAAYRRKLSMTSSFYGAVILNSVDVGRVQDPSHSPPNATQV